MKIGNEAQNDACKDRGRKSSARPTVGDIGGVFDTRTCTHSPSSHVGGFFHADHLWVKH